MLPGPVVPAANSQPSGQFGLTGRRECRALLMADADPFDLAAADGVGEGIKRIPDQPENMFDADLFERTDQYIGHCLRHSCLLLLRYRTDQGVSTKVVTMALLVNLR